MTTAIIILNYNNYEDTINCIESVERYNTASVKYIVVDNGSTRNGTVEALGTFLSDAFGDNYRKFDYEHDDKPQNLPYVSFIVSKTNDGYARGNNKGLAFAQTDEEIGYIIILNNDILFVEDIIGKLIDYQQRLPQCAIVSPILYKKGMNEFDLNCARLNQTNWEVILSYLFLFKSSLSFFKRSERRRCLLLHNQPNNNSVLNVELPSGSCLLFKKSLMNEMNIFDTNTYLYYEENILFKQIQHIDKRNYVVKDLRCIHLGGYSIRKNKLSYTAGRGLESADYYLHRYCHPTIIQRVVWRIAKSLFVLKLKMLKHKERQKMADDSSDSCGNL